VQDGADSEWACGRVSNRATPHDEARLRLGKEFGQRQHRNCQEQDLVRVGRMRRTWKDWGFPNGYDSNLTPMLLMALTKKATGTRFEIANSESFGSGIVTPHARTIETLIASTGLSADHLANDLRYDIKHWRSEQAVMHRASQARIDEATESPAPLDEFARPEWDDGMLRDDLGARWLFEEQVEPDPAPATAVSKREALADQAEVTPTATPESMTAAPQDDPPTHPSPVTVEDFRQPDDRLQKMVVWAKWKYGDGPFPSREDILDQHRADFGMISGISEPLIRCLLQEVAPGRKGGAPTHRSRA
jgi:hypothetical protein